MSDVGNAIKAAIAKKEWEERRIELEKEQKKQAETARLRALATAQYEKALLYLEQIAQSCADDFLNEIITKGKTYVSIFSIFQKGRAVLKENNAVIGEGLLYSFADIPGHIEFDAEVLNRVIEILNKKINDPDLRITGFSVPIDTSGDAADSMQCIGILNETKGAYTHGWGNRYL